MWLLNLISFKNLIVIMKMMKESIYVFILDINLILLGFDVWKGFF